MNLRIRGQMNRVCLVIAAAALLPGCFAAPPRLQIQDADLDGGILGSDDREITIPIRNTGGSPLLISGIGTSCTCTVAKSPDRLEPGAESVIRVSVPADGGGPRSSRLVIDSNDPDGPRELYFRWFAAFEPRLVPPRLVLHGVRPGTELRPEVAIIYGGGSSDYPLKVLESSVSSPAIAIRQTGDDSRATHADIFVENRNVLCGETRFVIEHVAADRTGVVRESCRFVCEQAGRRYDLTLPIEIHVEGPLVAQGSLTFHGSSVTALLGSKRTISVNAATADQALQVVESPDFMSCEVQQLPTPAGNLWKLIATLKSPPNQPGDTHQIALQLGQDRFTRLDIPVRIFWIDP